MACNCTGNDREADAMTCGCGGNEEEAEATTCSCGCQSPADEREPAEVAG